jgi:hypothetical protein
VYFLTQPKRISQLLPKSADDRLLALLFVQQNGNSISGMFSS